MTREVFPCHRPNVGRSQQTGNLSSGTIISYEAIRRAASRVTYIVSVYAPPANRHCAILARIQGGVLEHIPPESSYALMRSRDQLGSVRHDDVLDVSDMSER